jgi:hypothetical protein
MTEESNKFETVDFPKIIEAIQIARTARQFSRVTIEIAENGGVVGIQVESKKKIK